MPAARRAFRRALLEVLMAPWPRRNHITLLLTEVDPGALLLWLRPLVKERRLGWRIVCHVEDGAREPADQWPAAASRRFGPPREGERAVAELAATEETPRTMLLCAEGARAGSLLVLETGLHQFVGVRENPREKLHFLCQPMTWRSRLEADDWGHPLVNAPSSKENREALRALPPIRQLTREDRPPPGPYLWWLPITHESYWEEFEDVALEHLLAVARVADGSLEDLPVSVLPLDPRTEP
jgi:hypothetical protein